MVNLYNQFHKQGLVIIGVHAPEFEFEKKVDNIQNAVNRFGITYPIAIGDMVIGSGAACALGCLSVCGAGIFAFCQDAMGNLNLIKMPEGQVNQDGKTIIEISDLEKAEMVRIKEVLPKAPSDEAVLKQISDKSGINVIDLTSPNSQDRKKLYLPSSPKLVDVNFNDIRKQANAEAEIIQENKERILSRFGKKS